MPEPAQQSPQGFGPIDQIDGATIGIEAGVICIRDECGWLLWQSGQLSEGQSVPLEHAMRESLDEAAQKRQCLQNEGTSMEHTKGPWVYDPHHFDDARGNRSNSTPTVC